MKFMQLRAYLENGPLFRMVSHFCGQPAAAHARAQCRQRMIERNNCCERSRILLCAPAKYTLFWKDRKKSRIDLSRSRPSHSIGGHSCTARELCRKVPHLADLRISICQPIHHLRKSPPVNLLGGLAPGAGPEQRSAPDLEFAEFDILTIDLQRERGLSLGKRRIRDLGFHFICVRQGFNGTLPLSSSHRSPRLILALLAFGIVRLATAFPRDLKNRAQNSD